VVHAMVIRKLVSYIRWPVLAGVLMAWGSASVHAISLPELLKASGDAHPSVLAARFDADAAEQEIEVAKRQYWPTLSTVLEAGSGAASNPSRILRVEQPLWDGGFTQARVTQAEQSAAVAVARISLQKQTLALGVLDAWKALLSGRERLRVVSVTLESLSSYEGVMERRVKAELSTRIDLELVRSRILQARVEADQAGADVRAAIRRLERFTGLTGLSVGLKDVSGLPGGEGLDRAISEVLAADWPSVLEEQVEVSVAVEDARLSKSTLSAKIAEPRPRIYVRLDQGLSDRRATAAYVGLSYSPGAGFSSFVEAGALAKRVQSMESNVDSVRLEIGEKLLADRNELVDGRRRMDALMGVSAAARQVLESYERQFVAGRKTWPDLMNAVRDRTQADYALADARTALVAALHRLQLRTNLELIESAASGANALEGKYGTN